MIMVLRNCIMSERISPLITGMVVEGYELLDDDRVEIRGDLRVVGIAEFA